MSLFPGRSRANPGRFMSRSSASLVGPRLSGTFCKTTICVVGRGFPGKEGAMEISAEDLQALLQKVADEAVAKVLQPQNLKDLGLKKLIGKGGHLVQIRRAGLAGAFMDKLGLGTKTHNVSEFARKALEIGLGEVVLLANNQHVNRRISFRVDAGLVERINASGETLTNVFLFGLFCQMYKTSTINLAPFQRSGEADSE